jgi:hypothetical protein
MKNEEKGRAIKNRKRRKCTKKLKHKKRKRWKNSHNMAIKKEELEIKFLAHELLASTLYYIMLTPW